MTKEEFESKYHYKIVKPLGKHYKIPIKEYVVTSALYNYEDDSKTTIFAIKALDSSVENKDWITIKINSDEFDKCMADFEIIRDGYEEIRPIILDEFLSFVRKQYVFVYKSIFDIEKPSLYTIDLSSDFKTFSEIEEYVKPFREDVLHNKVVYNINQRLIKK